MTVGIGRRIFDGCRFRLREPGRSSQMASVPSSSCPPFRPRARLRSGAGLPREATGFTLCILAARLAKSCRRTERCAAGSYPVSYRPQPSRLPVARGNGRSGPDDTPIQPDLCDKIRQHYCPKFVMPEILEHRTRPIYKNLGHFATENCADAQSKRKLRSPAHLRDQPAGFTAFRSPWHLARQASKSAMVALDFSQPAMDFHECSLHPTTGRAPIPRSPPACRPMPAALPTAYGDGDLDQNGRAALHRDLRTRGRGLLRRHRHGRQLAVAGRVQPPRRHLLLPSRSACASRTNAARRNIFTGGSRLHRRRRRRWARSIRRSLSATISRFPPDDRPWRTADGGHDHPGDRSRHRLQPGRNRRRSPRSPRSTICRCTWTARASPTRWSRSTTTPAEMTWKRGVDILSFGGTKNGCWCAEAVVLFDPDQAPRKCAFCASAPPSSSPSRASSPPSSTPISKTVSGWITPATPTPWPRGWPRHRGFATARLAWLPQANEVLPSSKRTKAEKLQAAGAAFYDWHTPHSFDGDRRRRRRPLSLRHQLRDDGG